MITIGHWSLWLLCPKNRGASHFVAHGLHSGYRYQKLRKTFGKLFRSYSDLWWNIVPRICFWRNLLPDLLQWSCQETKEGQMRSEFRLVGLENCKTPLTSQVWPSDDREDDMSCALPFYSLVQIYPNALHWLTLRLWGLWQDLTKFPKRRQGPDPRPLWLLIWTPSVLGPELASRQAEHSVFWRVTLYIFDILILSPYMSVRIFMASPLRWLLVLVLYKEDYLQMFKCVSFWLHSFCW